MKDESDFEIFLHRRREAASAYVSGDAMPLAEMLVRTAPASVFGPRGGARQGAEEVSATYAQDAQHFAKGGDTHLEILHLGSSGDLGYWAGFQRANARLMGRTEVEPMSLRVTEVFRRENGEWRLVHRHADMLASEPEPSPG